MRFTNSPIRIFSIFSLFLLLNEIVQISQVLQVVQSILVDGLLHLLLLYGWLRATNHDCSANLLEFDLLSLFQFCRFLLLFLPLVCLPLRANLLLEV